MSARDLALLGGPKAVTIQNPEQWPPPIDREIELCAQVIRERAFSQTNAGIPGEFECRFKESVGPSSAYPRTTARQPFSPHISQ